MRVNYTRHRFGAELVSRRRNCPVELPLLVPLDGAGTFSCHTSLGAPAHQPVLTPCQHFSSHCGITHPELLQGSSLQLHGDFREWTSWEQNKKHFVNSGGSELVAQSGQGWFAKPPTEPLSSQS